MISIYKIEESKVSPSDNFKKNDERVSVEIRGLSTDDKPTSVGAKGIDNGSVYIELDTGKVFLYDLEQETWNEV